MPLTTQQYDQLTGRLKAARKDFEPAWRVLVGQQLVDLDERLRTDVKTMPLFAALRPLPDADRVVLRTRALWLLANHAGIRGEAQTVPATWTLIPTLEALQAFDGDVDRCPRSEPEMKLLNALVEFYVDRIVLERITPKIAQWIEATTRDGLEHLRAPDRERNAVQAVVEGLTRAAMVAGLAALGQLGTPPAEIRKAPFKVYITVE